MSSHEMDELDEQFEVVVGRKAPLTLVPDWVTLYPASKSHPKYRGQILSPQAKAVYNVLAMHVNVSRGDSSCWPSRKTIARMLGFSREQSVDQYLDQLDDADAIDREPITRANGAKGVRYIVHQTPPDGYEGETSVSEHYRNRREEEARKLSRGPGRPRKAKPAPEAEQPAPEAEPETMSADAAARAVADEWWAQAEELADQGELDPLGTDRQKDRARANLAARIHDARAAGHDPELIKLTLQEVGEWGPAKAKFERMLTTLKDKTPEEIALDKQAQRGATKWWEEAERLVAAKRMGPLMVDTKRQRTGYFLNLKIRIRAALAAGYESRLIWQALMDLGEWSPAKREFDRALRRLAGVRTPRAAGNGRGPLFSNDQWKQNETPAQGGTPEVPSAPDLSVFGVQSDDAA